MRRLRSWVAITLIVLTSFLFLVQAQVGTSTLTGRVTDQTNAVVPGVSVTIVNTETNFRFPATTNQDGMYRVPSLAPGSYRLTFEAVGFKKLMREDITLRSEAVMEVDVALEIGSLTEAVQVSGAAPLLETATSSVGTLVAGSYLYILPSYQRLINLAIYLEPGMTTAGSIQPASLNGFHVGGQRATTIGMFEDGVTGNDPLTGTTSSQSVMNSVVETKVLSTTLPAEYGHSAGGVIAVVKASGSNEFHGMASFQGRTRTMMQRRFFDVQRNDQANGPLGADMSVYCQPDGNFAGPVYLPKIYDGRNRTFFFFGWQHLVEKKSAGSSTTTPTPEMKRGDFSFGGIGNPIYDPRSTALVNGAWTRTVFPNQQVPVSQFDPVAAKILQVNPWVDPNVPSSINASGPAANLLYNAKSRQFTYDLNTRIDQQFGPNFKIYGSWTYNSRLSRAQLSLVPVTAIQYSGTGNYSPYRYQNYSIGATWIISTSLVNDARIGYLRQSTTTISPSYEADGQSAARSLAIPNLPLDGMPAFGVYGLTATGPGRSVWETISFRDDVSKMSGTHAFKMGYEVLRHRLDSYTVGTPSGNFSFAGMTAGLQASGALMPRTGNDFAGFLLGSIASATFTKQLATWLPRSSINSFYVQDDWRLRPTLTLNLGIRYTNESPYNTKYGQQSTFDPTVTDPVTGKLGAIVHSGSALNHRDNNNFQPRFGLAWHPLEKWVFRGGFAMYTVDVRFPAARIDMDEYTALAIQQRPPGDPRPIYQISQMPGAPVYALGANGTAPYSGTNYSSRTVDWWDANLRNPYVLNWNVSVQRQLSKVYVVELMYQGSAGVGLVENWNINTFPIDYGSGNPALQASVLAAPQNYRPYPQFGNISFRSNMGHSTFHSASVKLEKQYSHGLTFQTFYTFSKAIDSQDTDNSGSGVAPIQNRSLEKARAGYDRNHVWIGSEVWEVPVGHGRRFLGTGHRVLDWIVGGYQINFIQSLESGNPLTFSYANNPANEWPTWVGDWRPNLIGKPALLPNWRNFGGDRFNLQGINPIIDINNFAYPAAYTAGNSGRNIVTGMPLYSTRGSIQKVFEIKERFKLMLRADMMNPFHIFNLGPPTTAVDFQNPKTFAKCSGTNEPLSTAWGGQPHIDVMVQLKW
jgi:hypothetical protein